MELLQQHLFPQRGELVDHRRRRTAGGKPPQLGFAQQSLATSIADLGGRLRRQRASVHLEVQLARPHRYRSAGRGLAFDVAEELLGGADCDTRSTVEIGHAPRPFHHLPGRAAASVAVTEGHQRPVAPPVIFEVAVGVAHLGRGELGVVCVNRGEMSEHPGAI